MHLNDLSDEAAAAECRRLFLVEGARRREIGRWFSFDDTPTEYDEHSGFAIGMLAMFRYARGENVPPFIVRDFIDDFLKLMFCGLASNTLALPPFKRMQDKPWANAWRAAELRLAIEDGEDIDIAQLAHLLGRQEQDLRAEISELFPDTGDIVPRGWLTGILETLRGLSTP